MPTATQRITRVTMWKVVVVGACLCLFLFGLQAKLAQYQDPSPSVTAVRSAKLWESDQRMEVQNVLDVTGLLLLAILLQFQQSFVETSVPLPVFSRPAPVRLFSLSHLRRFFRPPPAR